MVGGAFSRFPGCSKRLTNKAAAEENTGAVPSEVRLRIFSRGERSSGRFQQPLDLLYIRNNGV